MEKSDFAIYEKNGEIYSIGIKFNNFLRKNNLPAMIGGGNSKFKNNGYNYYKKVSDSKCKEAVDWWNQNEEKWALVRNKWEDIYSKNKDISLKKLINNKPLFSYLFNKEIKKETEITSIIDNFVKK